MSEQNQPKPNKDIELAKINLVADEWRGDYRDTVNYYLTALIAVLAVELTVVIGFELAGNFWGGIVYFLTFLVLEGPFFFFILRRTGRRYKRKLSKVNFLIKKVEGDEPLGDVESLMQEEKPESTTFFIRTVRFLLRAIRFGTSCFALSAILFGIQYISLYFQSVINGTTSTYIESTVRSLSSWVDWTTGVFIAVFFGGLMIAALILVIPWTQLEKSAMIRRGKKLVGL